MSGIDKNKLKNIQPGNGLGILKFGISREEAEKLLGKPNEIEEHAYSDGDTAHSEAWHYDDLELSIEFDEEEDWRLVTISVSSDFYEFKRKKFIGLSESKLISLLKELEIDDYEVEELSPVENPSQKLISIDKFALNFWFENDVLMEIQWYPLYIDDDTIDWPE